MKVAKKNMSFITKVSGKYIYNKVYTDMTMLKNDIEKIKNTCDIENKNENVADSVKNNNNKIIEKLEKIVANYSKCKLLYVVNNIVKMYIDNDNNLYADSVYADSVASRFGLSADSVNVIGSVGDDKISDDVKNIVALCKKEK